MHPALPCPLCVVQLKRFEDAKAAHEAAAAAKPTMTVAHRGRARMSMALNMFDDAIAAINAAKELQPDDGSLLAERAYVCVPPPPPSSSPLS